MSLDPVTAIREANQGLAQKIEPYIFCSYTVDVEDIFNLADEAGRQSAGVEESVMAASWLTYIAAQTKPPQWTLVEDMIARGAAGVLVPSYAPGATTEDRNLVLWRWGPTPPHRIEVFDPSGRLPKNQLSWD